MGKMKIDLADFSGPGQGTELLRNAIGSSISVDIFEGAKSATVRVAYAPIRNADSDDPLVSGDSTNPTSGSVPQEVRFRFYGYIQKIDDIPVPPNAYYQDICDPSYTGNTKEASQVIAMYPQFESTYKDVPPNPGDIVKVTLATSTDWPVWNGQFGYFDGIEKIKNDADVNAQSTACTSLAEMDWAQAGTSEAGEIQHLASLGKQIPNYDSPAYAKRLCPQSDSVKKRMEYVAENIGVSYKAMLAIALVETGGCNRRRKDYIQRFERHWFLGRNNELAKLKTQGFGNGPHPEHMPWDSSAWITGGQKYTGNNSANNTGADYTKGSGGIPDFKKGYSIDKIAAIMSTSWGSHQIMGRTIRFAPSSATGSLKILHDAVKSEAGAAKFWKTWQENTDTALAMGDELAILWYKHESPGAAAAANTATTTNDWRAFASMYNGSGCCDVYGARPKYYHLKLKYAYLAAVKRCDPKSPPTS